MSNNGTASGDRGLKTTGLVGGIRICPLADTKIAMAVITEGERGCLYGPLPYLSDMQLCVYSLNFGPHSPCDRMWRRNGQISQAPLPAARHHPARTRGRSAVVASRTAQGGHRGARYTRDTLTAAAGSEGHHMSGQGWSDPQAAFVVKDRVVGDLVESVWSAPLRGLFMASFEY